MSDPFPFYPTKIDTFPVFGSGIASGYEISPYHVSDLYLVASGIESTIGISPLNNFASLTARITGIETGYYNLVKNNLPLMYRASIAINYAPPASSTDFFVFQGNSTNIVRIYRVDLAFYNAGGVGPFGLQFLRRKTANTGGSTALMSIDNNGQAAAISAPFYYTANPATLGTLNGQLPVLQMSTNQNIYTADFTNFPIVISGTSDYVVLNLNGATEGGSDITVTFSESAT